MLIRLFEINCCDDKDPYEDATFLKAYRENDYASFVKMLSYLKDNGESEGQIAVGDEWYFLDTYVFCFPEDSERLPCINVYVV